MLLSATTDLDGIGAVFGDTRAALGLVLGLGLCGTGLAYILYYRIVERLGAVAASGVTYIPPVVSLAIGAMLVGEPSNRSTSSRWGRSSSAWPCSVGSRTCNVMTVLGLAFSSQPQARSINTETAELRSLQAAARSKHAEEIARLVGVRQEIELLVEIASRQLGADIAKGGEVFHGEADGIEEGDLPIVRTPGHPPADHIGEFRDGVILRQVLDLALDARLRRIFDEDGRPQEISRCKLGLSGQSPPTALMWTPSPTRLSVRIVAFCLSAVTVVMICAPSTASSTLEQAAMSKPKPDRLRWHFCVAPGRCRRDEDGRSPEGP